mmetsp:Transcript_64396/g.153592  ORF Transcript_64396/g.153592 Transcript_64396/m.153592 type:complete len:552 (-) Transcript_64396:47-1702(-)
MIDGTALPAAQRQAAVLLGLDPLTSIGYGHLTASKVLTLCLSVLATAYFVVRSCSALVRLISGPEGAPLLRRLLSDARATLKFAPVLSALFLASEMHAMELAKFGQWPPTWIRTCMIVATSGLIVQMFLAVLAPLCCGTGQRRSSGGDYMKLDEDAILLVGNSPFALFLSVMVMATVYGACIAICFGITSMKSVIPGETHPVAPSVVCTANLSIQYFAVNFLLFLAFVLHRLWRSRLTSRLVAVLRLAVGSMFFAPMLCVLFIGTRLRALQVDPVNGMPQPWAQAFFYIATYSMLAQTILIILLPLIPPFDARRGSEAMDGDVELAVSGLEQNPLAFTACSLLRFTPTLVVAVSVIAIICSSFTITGPYGQPPIVPPALQCVDVLTLEFFLVYLLLWKASGVISAVYGRHALRADRPGAGVVKTIKALAATVEYCPMLTVLFILLRMVAQELTGHTGRPQGWAQDAMYVCTTAVTFQLLSCILIAIASRSAPEVDEDGGVYLGKLGDNDLGILAAVLRVLSSFAIYTGVAAVCIALWTLTPATAGGPGTFH